MLRSLRKYCVCQDAIEKVLSSDGVRFKWLVLASEAMSSRSRVVSGRRQREEEQKQSAANAWTESRVWMGKY